MPSCKIAVRLSPRASSEQIVGERDGALVVRVTAPPVDGRANTALCRLLAKTLGVGVRSVAVVHGAGAREKLVRIEGMSEQEVRRALQRPRQDSNLGPAD
jgi:uncharacterized protein